MLGRMDTSLEMLRSTGGLRWERPSDLYFRKAGDWVIAGLYAFSKTVVLDLWIVTIKKHISHALRNPQP